MDAELGPAEVLAFVDQHVESVPHLEALLLIWQGRPRAWSASEVARRVYLPQEKADRLLQDLVDQHWVVPGGDGYTFNAESADAPVIAHLAETYRSNLIRIAEVIHRKAPSAVRDFARAFDLRKER
jgi:hypothetical protein